MLNQVEKIAELITAVIEREKPEGIALMGISNTWGAVEIQVDSDYFDRHFHGVGVEITDHSRDHDCHSWTTASGAKIFCLKKAKWQRVA
jgi:hypothetical protein